MGGKVARSAVDVVSLYASPIAFASTDMGCADAGGLADQE